MKRTTPPGGGARRGLTAAAAALAGVCALTPVAAVNVQLSAADTQRALRLAGAADGARAQFHAAYVLPIRDSMIQEIQVLTEFRRTVLAAEEARRRGDWAVAQGARSLGGQGVEETVKPWRGIVTLSATLQLDALHTFVAVPNCELMLGGTPVVASAAQRTIPRSAVASPGRGATTTSLVGGTIESDFKTEAVAQESRLIVVLCDGREAARQAIDFSRLE
ncbi:MAG: hypothetical protein ABJC51_10775 [Acidobacteriota bacterium]